MDLECPLPEILAEQELEMNVAASEAGFLTLHFARLFFSNFDLCIVGHMMPVILASLCVIESMLAWETREDNKSRQAQYVPM